MKTSVLFLGLCLLLSGVAHAEPQNNLLGFSLGATGIADGDDDTAVDARVDYQFAQSFLTDIVHPWLGVEITSDASLWAGGGLLADWNFAPSWNLTPSIGAGYYARGSSDDDLDYPLEFRSQLELSYQCESNHRVGVAFSHTSNASLGDRNPGTEAAVLTYKIPVGF